MIVVRVELWSARTGERTELARMRIANDGEGSASLRNYDGATFQGRSKGMLDREHVQRRGRLERFPSQRLHVWNLVAEMLANMGYRL
jgi:hypothetical protein